jgi:hypothetical protein
LFFGILEIGDVAGDGVYMALVRRRPPGQPAV